MSPKRMGRSSTGIPGLDIVLEGGLVPHSSYLLSGTPGSGKTVLASQLAFNLAARGECTCFVSGLTEPYSHLIRNLEGLHFFDSSLINQGVTFISALAVLEDEGLAGLENMLRLTLMKRRVAMVVLDSLSALGLFAQTPQIFRTTLRKIIALCSMAESTLVATSEWSDPWTQSQYAAFDWIIELRQDHGGRSGDRALEVMKSRGSSHLQGEHAFTIDSSGVRVFPRFETRFRKLPRIPAEFERLSVGVQEVDEMLGGGVIRGTTTSLAGPTGVGKTLFGASFLGEGLRRGEKGVYFGFHESPERYLAAAEGIGVSLRGPMEKGFFRVEWHRSGDASMDEIAQWILDVVEDFQPRRVVIDSIKGMHPGAYQQVRFEVIFATLAKLLQSRGITTILIGGPRLAGDELPPRLGQGFSIHTENLFVMRYVETSGRLDRIFSVVKTRGSSHDPTSREFWIHEKGFSLAAPLMTPPMHAEESAAEGEKGGAGGVHHS